MRVERCNGLFIIGWLCVLAGVYLLLGMGAVLVVFGVSLMLSAIGAAVRGA